MQNFTVILYIANPAMHNVFPNLNLFAVHVENTTGG